MGNFGFLVKGQNVDEGSQISTKTLRHKYSFNNVDKTSSHFLKVDYKSVLQ